MGSEQWSGIEICPLNWISLSQTGRVLVSLTAFYLIKGRGSWPMGRPRKIAICHPERRNKSRGLCSPCYQRKLKVDGRTRQYDRTYRYGLDAVNYALRRKQQNDACAVCKVSFDVSSDCVDHDHSCCPEKAYSCGNCVRGLLCTTCNTLLGHAKDDPSILRAAADYLEKSLA